MQNQFGEFKSLVKFKFNAKNETSTSNTNRITKINEHRKNNTKPHHRSVESGV
jgi:hypothetical protein